MDLAERVRFRVLGDVDLRRAGGEPASEVLCQPKRIALLSYLTLEGAGGFIRKDRIVALFWPESDRVRARSSLRQALRFLRTRLGGEVFETRGKEDLRVRRNGIDCDALRFRGLAGSGESENALRLYRGPLLEGFHLDGCHEFQEWIEQRRTEYSASAARLAWDIADGARANGDPSGAAYWAKRALSMSNFDEPGVRRLIKLLLDVQDHVGAMRAFKGLERRLRMDLGIGVSPATRSLVAHLALDDDAAPAASTSRGRRSGEERRTGDRRDARSRPPVGVDRRSGEDRRSTTRRRLPDRRQEG